MTDTFKGIITADGKKRQLPYGSILEAPVSDATLSVDGGFADSKAVGDKFKEVKSETNSLKEDLGDLKDYIEYDKIIVDSTSSGNVYVDFDVKLGATYIFTVDSAFNCSIATVSETNTTIENVGNLINGNSITFTANQNAPKILFYFRASGSATVVRIDRISKLENNLEAIYDNFALYYSKQWAHEKWSSYGDSISWLYGWQNDVNTMIGFDSYIRNGKPGSTITWSNSVFHIDSNGIYDTSETGETVHEGFCSWERISKCIDNTLPVIFVMGGTNDFLSAKPLGDTEFDASNSIDTAWRTKNPIGDYNINSLKGAMASMFMKLQYHAPNALIVFGTLLNGIGDVVGVNQYVESVNGLNLKPSDYSRAEKEVCEEFGIPYIDVFGTCGINVTNRASYISDTVHPNSSGMKLLSRCVASGLAKELRRI